MLAIRVKPGLCKNCYACIRACEVKATSIKQGQASLLEEDCLSCGACLAVCPQHAREIRDDTSTINNLLKGATPVWASLAPSAALGPYSFAVWEERLRDIGFAGVSLTSWGAVPVSAAYTAAAKKNGWVLTTACPAAVRLVCRFFPKLTQHLAPVASPMVTHAAWLKQTYKARVVFIGPCPAKKREAAQNTQVDGVLTFEEAEKLIGVHSQLSAVSCQQTDANISNSTRSQELGAGSHQVHLSFSCHGLMHYPIPGGLASQTDVPVLSIDGVDELMGFLSRLEKGETTPEGIVEISACRGSCLGGAVAYRRELSLAERRQLLAQVGESCSHQSTAVRSVHLPSSRRRTAPEETVQDILRQLGKTDSSQEYNCGACGYHTCRDKAAAVAEGRAELEMCLPYMRAKAESLANLILESTPNAVVVVSKDLIIEEWNVAAERMFGIPSSQALGKPLSDFLPDEAYSLVLSQQDTVSGRKVVLRPDLITSLTITPVKGGELAMGVYSDITQMEEQSKALLKVRQETLEKAQEVINKQMRVAQEIASLLGETTAESKMLLLKLMRVVQGDR